MPVSNPTAFAFNRSRHTSLAERVTIANTHWSRLVGLMGKDSASFVPGDALWIVPCRGVHTLGMRFPIDVVYLDKDKFVVHVEENLRPWRVAPVRMRAASVLELPAHTLGSTRTVMGDQLEIGVGEIARMARA